MWTQERTGEFIKKEHNHLEIVRIDGFDGYYTAWIGNFEASEIKNIEHSKQLFIQKFGFEPSENTLIITSAIENHLLSFTNDFENFNEANKYLEEQGIPTLFVPQKVQEYGKWFCFGNRFGKKISETEMQIVLPDRFKDNDFHIRVRDTQYYSDDQFMEDVFLFIQENGKNPLNDVETEAYEASGHGSSGMDRNHYDLKTEQDVLGILRNTYGIEVNSISWSC